MWDFCLLLATHLYWQVLHEADAIYEVTHFMVVWANEHTFLTCQNCLSSFKNCQIIHADTQHSVSIIKRLALKQFD